MKIKGKQWGTLGLALLMALSCAACGENAESGEGGGGPQDTDPPAPPVTTDAQKEVDEKLATASDEEFTLLQLCGTDALGRKVSPLADLNDKYVGLFYFLTMGQVEDPSDPTQRPKPEKVYDISEIIKKYGIETLDDAVNSPLLAMTSGSSSGNYDAAVSAEGEAHYWGQPLYGYYRTDDPWVVKRHVELFMNAGIDFLYLDYTNNIIYEEATKVLLDAILELQAEGYKNVPRVVPMLSYIDSWASYCFGGRLYPAFFSDERYKSCWFYGDEELNPSGKPLLVGNLSANEPHADEFWIKNIQWPTRENDDDAVPWMDFNVVQRNHNGFMVVTVAQGRASSSEAYFNPGATYEARGWSIDNMYEHGTDEEGVMSGRNFEFKWQNAIKAKDELKVAMVTGWNEWTVRKINGNKEIGVASQTDHAEFVDNFSMAYSRDIEMMKGGYGDNYYMQLVRNIRSFKGITVDGIENVASNKPVTISLDDLSGWENVTRKYLDMGAATMARNFTAVDRDILYTDNSNRNDIDHLKICNDGENLYVAVTAKEDITPHTAGDGAWMNLYLSVKGEGWAGYDLLVNRSPQNGTTSVEKFTGKGSETQNVGSARYLLSGKTIVFAIPLSVLGASASDVIEIKATDNLQNFGDPDDFYISGDSAPMGRLNYAYRLA